MGEIQFSDNINDLSTDSDFQFEFYCEHCRDAWRSPFDRYAAGTAENLLSSAEGADRCGRGSDLRDGCGHSGRRRPRL